MIRRQLADGRYGLVTQDDHARLAGWLGGWVGTSMFELGAMGTRRSEVLSAIHLHDAGWTAHDRFPTVDDRGRPMDVFDSPRSVSLAVWPGAVQEAARSGTYAELLVSIHMLTLSAYATGPGGVNQTAAETDTLPMRFEMNKFQHKQIERQGCLRAELGLSMEVPLTLGLVDLEEVESGEEKLACEIDLMRHYRWLAAMDLMSLAICCTEVPVARTEGVLVSSREGQWQPLDLRRDGDDLRVHPWPFRVEEIEVCVAFRAVEGRIYAGNKDLQRAWDEGERGGVVTRITPR